MPKKSQTGSREGNVVRRTAAEIPPASPAGLDRLRAAMYEPVDTSDIPEMRRAVARVGRDAAGRLPARRESPVRQAVLDQLERQRMSRYRLWQEARRHCPTNTTSAVYGFLKGEREIGVQYAEALMASVGLSLSRTKDASPSSRGGRGRRKVGMGHE
jgi:hypothetical protein